MGHRVNPISLRLGINQTWQSRWLLTGAEYVQALHEELRMRAFVKKRLKAAGISRVIFERAANKLRLTIYCARPGLVIGKKGSDIESMTKELSAFTETQLSMNVVEVRRPEIDAQLVAENIAQQLERRVSFRRAMKRAIQGARRLEAEGIRVNCAGRIGGAEIARTEWYREGRVPLQTLRGYVDYGFSEAHTASGVCGVKVWVYKGELQEHNPFEAERTELRLQGASR